MVFKRSQQFVRCGALEIKHLLLFRDRFVRVTG